MKKASQARRPQQRSGSRKGRSYAGRAFEAADVALSEETLELVWRLVRRGHQEDVSGMCGGYLRMTHDLLRARRVAFTRRFTRLAEDLRTEDLGVTVTTAEQAVFPAGLSWWEWDARIAGRLPAQPGEVDCDRLGVMALSDQTGRRGTMHMVAGADGTAEILPFCCHFDWREDFEPPASIVPRPSVGEVGRAMRSAPDITPAQSDGSAVAMAALSRRFGVGVSPYVGAEYARLLGCEGDDAWYLTVPHVFADSVRDTMQEAEFMFASAVLLRSAPAAMTKVPRGARVAALAGPLSRAVLEYSVADVGCGARPPEVGGWVGSASAGAV